MRCRWPLSPLPAATLRPVRLPQHRAGDNSSSEALQVRWAKRWIEDGAGKSETAMQAFGHRRRQDNQPRAFRSATHPWSLHTYPRFLTALTKPSRFFRVKSVQTKKTGGCRLQCCFGEHIHRCLLNCSAFSAQQLFHLAAIHLPPFERKG